ncbi:MAG: RnfABCDGE type electron transport complex subunit G, partial [Paludibacter sp.]|nr:RnfABCDGE type electron transport complex subunit G [Paludibacter sp.]
DKDGNFVGAAVESVSHKGFSGDIRVMVGFDKDGNIVDYSVLEQKETPGLGTKMTDWFKTAKGAQDIRGKNPAKNKLQVSKDGGEVDAITAATISSRAFLDAVINAYNAYATNSSAPTVDGNTGATSTEY